MTVPQGTVEGKRKRGRQRKRWTDNNYRGMDREQWRGREREADRGNDGQTVQRNGQGNH